MDRPKRTASVSFKTFPETKVFLRQLADENDIPMAAMVRMLIAEAFKARGVRRDGDRIRRAA